MGNRAKNQAKVCQKNSAFEDDSSSNALKQRCIVYKLLMLAEPIHKCVFDRRPHQNFKRHIHISRRHDGRQDRSRHKKRESHTRRNNSEWTCHDEVYKRRCRLARQVRFRFIRKRRRTIHQHRTNDQERGHEATHLRNPIVHNSPPTFRFFPFQFLPIALDVTIPLHFSAYPHTRSARNRDTTLSKLTLFLPLFATKHAKTANSFDLFAAVLATFFLSAPGKEKLAICCKSYAKTSNFHPLWSAPPQNLRPQTHRLFCIKRENVNSETIFTPLICMPVKCLRHDAKLLFSATPPNFFHPPRSCNSAPHRQCDSLKFARSYNLNPCAGTLDKTLRSGSEKNLHLSKKLTRHESVLYSGGLFG